MRIYLDNAATTRVTEAVFEAMKPYFCEIYGNPASEHGFGRDARRAVDAARAQVAQALGAQAGEIYFTASGTEADNWAIRCAGKGHVITSVIEHHAVLHSCRRLEEAGVEVTYLPVDADGLVSPEALRAAMRPETSLVSVMLANNEIGAVQPVAELAAIAHAGGALFHTDAVQAVGMVPIDVEAMGIDMLSLSGHKFHAPKGVGALYLRRGVRLGRLMEGGAQERGMRPGTENLASIVGLGKAIALATEDVPARAGGMLVLREHLIKRLLEENPGAALNGHPVKRVSGNVNVRFEGVDARTLLLRLDLMGIAASAGSACTSGATEPSHVLTAIGLTPEQAGSTLRLSLSDETTLSEVDAAADAIRDILADMGGRRNA